MCTKDKNFPFYVTSDQIDENMTVMKIQAQNARQMRKTRKGKMMKSTKMFPGNTSPILNATPCPNM
jgi:hypothetical protein